MENQDETELAAQFEREFMALIGSPAWFQVELSPVNAWIIMAQLQFALRHPDNTGPSAVQARAFAQQLQQLVAPNGALAIMAERGWKE